MPDWMKKVFLTVLPKVLFINRPTKKTTLSYCQNSQNDNALLSLSENDSYFELDKIPKYCGLSRIKKLRSLYHKRGNFPEKITKALEGIEFVNKKMQKEVRIRDVSSVKC